METWGRDTTEHYSAGKKNQIVHFAGKQMELCLTMLSEETQSQRDKCSMPFLSRGF